MTQKEFEEKVAEIVHKKNCEIEDLENRINQMSSLFENRLWDIKRAERAEGYREAIEEVLAVLKGERYE